MADYQAQIRLGIQGLGQLQQLERRLQNATELLRALSQASANVDQAAQSASRRVSRAGSGIVRARQEVVDARAARLRGEGGRFTGADMGARRRAEANYRLAEIGLQQEARALREINEQRRKYAARLKRATRVIDEITPGIAERRAELRGQLRGIGAASRANYLTNLFQGRQREFVRGGSGANLSTELQQQARDVRAAFDLASASGKEGLGLMQRLATEMAGIVRQQNEVNRTGAGRSSAFESARRGQERLDVLAARPGVNDQRISRMRAQAASVIEASNRGDIAGARDLARRLNASIMRYTRELDAAARDLRQQQQLIDSRLTAIREGTNFGFGLAGDPVAKSIRRNQEKRAVAEAKLAAIAEAEAKAREALLARVQKNIDLSQAGREVSNFGFGLASDPVAKSIRRNQKKRAAAEAKLAAAQAKQANQADAAARAAEFRRTRGLSFDERLARRRPDLAGGRARGAAPQGFFRGDRRKAVAEGLIGGAFPLLFGQGLGASIGGAAGGVSGGLIGGSFGFGLSLIGTALGSAVDTTTNNLKELAAALKSPNDAITALEANGFRVGDSLKFQVEQLQAVGRAYDAQTLVLQEVERRLGAGSVQELNALNGEQKRLQESWAELSGEINRSLIPALIGFTLVLQDIVGLVNSVRNFNVDEAGRRKNFRFNIFTGERIDVPNPDDEPRARGRIAQRLKERIDASIATAPARVPLTPQEAFAAESTRIQTARGREALQRDIQQGELDLLRRKADIETSIADQRRAESDYEKEIADFRWNLEQRIFQLRSNAIRAEAEVANTMSQLRSAQIGLDFDERLLNAAPGAETEFLEASKNLLQTQEQTENRIAQNKISTELRIEDLKRQQVDRERQLEREKESLERRKEQLLRGRAQIERGIADYQIGAANYMRETAERVLDAWRQMNAEMQASAAVSGGGGATEIASRDLNANAKAWLKVIRYAEGTAGPRGYNTMFTGKQFNNFADHPRQLQSGGGYTSDAAGAYQFLSTTWDRTKRALGLPNFAPASQDKGAAYLAAMRGVDITSAPFTPQNVARLAPEWASLPTLQGRSYYGQPVKRFGDLQNVYRAGLVSASVGGSGGRGGFNGTMQTPPDGMMPLAQAALSPAKIPAPTRPTWQALPGAPNTAPMERGMQQAAERELAAVQNLLELQNSLAETEEKSAFNAMRRVALGQNRLQESEDQLRLQRYLGNAVGATTEREQEKLDLIAGQRAEYEKLLMDTDLQRREVERLQQVFAETEGKSGLSPERAQEINRLLDLRIQRQEESNRLDQQSLDLQQKRTALLERDSTLRAAAATGAGLRAGLIGPQAEALERGLIRGDSAEELRKNVEAAKALEDQQLIWDNLEKNIVDVSNAISGGLTNGLLDVISGARKIEDVGREVLDGIARTFADAAQQQLSTLMQRKLASMLGGPEGPLTKMLGGASAAAGPQALDTASLAASVNVWDLSAAAFAASATLRTIAGQAAISGAFSGFGSAAASGIGSAFSSAAPNILGSFFPGASPLPSFPFGGFRANGGTAVPGKGYIVGENEPEFFFPGVAGRVVPRSDMEKAAALQEGESSNEPIDIRYTVTEQRGERYVTEEQFRKGMASTSKRTQAMTYAGMRNNKQIREYTGI